MILKAGFYILVQRDEVLHLVLVLLLSFELLVLIEGVHLHLAVALVLLPHGHRTLLVPLSDLAHQRLGRQVRVFG